MIKLLFFLASKTSMSLLKRDSWQVWTVHLTQNKCIIIKYSWFKNLSLKELHCTMNVVEYTGSYFLHKDSTGFCLTNTLIIVECWNSQFECNKIKIAVATYSVSTPSSWTPSFRLFYDSYPRKSQNQTNTYFFIC